MSKAVAKFESPENRKGFRGRDDGMARVAVFDDVAMIQDRVPNYDPMLDLEDRGFVKDEEMSRKGVTIMMLPKDEAEAQRKVAAKESEDRIKKVTKTSDGGIASLQLGKFRDPEQVFAHDRERGLDAGSQSPTVADTDDD